MSTLEDAIKIAVKAHEKQIRKNGSPYILHPLRVMLKQTCMKSMIIAVLHDIIEDCDITFEDLMSKGFSEDILEVLKILTHDKNESYENYIEKITKNAVAIKIKIADLEDNMNLGELPVILDTDFERMKKYHKALIKLKAIKFEYP